MDVSDEGGRIRPRDRNVIMARHCAIHRQDLTSKALIAEIKARGADYVPIDGVIDGLVYHRGIWHVVDFKSKGGDLTPAQSKLVARGLPIRFLSTVKHVEEMLEPWKP